MSHDTTRPLIDSIGFIGNIFESALVIALVLSTIVVFIYLWKRGSLGYDEEAAQEMVNRDETYMQK